MFSPRYIPNTSVAQYIKVIQHVNYLRKKYRHDINVWCSLHCILSVITVGCRSLVADLEKVFLSPLFLVEWSYELSFVFFYSSHKCKFYSEDTSTKSQ